METEGLKVSGNATSELPALTNKIPDKAKITLLKELDPGHFESGYETPSSGVQTPELGLRKNPSPLMIEQAIRRNVVSGLLSDQRSDKPVLRCDKNECEDRPEIQAGPPDCTIDLVTSDVEEEFLTDQILRIDGAESKYPEPAADEVSPDNEQEKNRTAFPHCQHMNAVVEEGAEREAKATPYVYYNGGLTSKVRAQKRELSYASYTRDAQFEKDIPSSHFLYLSEQKYETKNSGLRGEELVLSDSIKIPECLPFAEEGQVKYLPALTSSRDIVEYFFEYLYDQSKMRQPHTLDRKREELVLSDLIYQSYLLSVVGGFTWTTPETQPTATSKLVGPELKLRQTPGHEEKTEEVYFQTPQQATTDGKSQLIVIDLALNTPAPYTVQRPLSKAVVTLPQCSAVQPSTIQCTPSQKVDIVHTKEATSGGQSSSPVQPIQHPFSIKQPIQEATQHIKGERVLLKNKMLTKDEYLGKEAVPVFAHPSRFSSDDDSMSYLISSREEFQPVQYGGGVFGLGGADLTELPDEWMNETPPPSPMFPSWCYQLDHPLGCETTPHPTPSIAKRFPPPVLEVKPFSILSWNHHHPSIPVNESCSYSRSDLEKEEGMNSY